jgi:conjugal transfer pilus assembly protein TraB
MSEEKKGLGLFISKAKPAAAGPAAPVGPKDVKKRWMYVAAAGVGLVVLASTIFGDKPAPRVAVSTKDGAMVNVTPPNADKAAFESRFAKDLETVRAETQALKAELAAARERGLSASAAATPPDGIVAPPMAPGSNTGGLGTLGSAPPPPPIPATPVFRPGVPDVPATGPAGTLPQLPALPGGGGSPMTFPAPLIDKPVASASGQASAAAKVRYTKNANAGTLSVGAFAPISLLNGVDAGTSTATQNNPLPLLMNITDQATLPGSAKFRLNNCFVLGTAYGDLSAERVYGRVSRISCVDKADRLVLNAEVQGYLVDSDGKLGMRGLISDRQGQRLGKALLAGFAQGLAGALGQSQGTVLSNLTSGDSTSSISGASALRASGLAGAQTATAQLAEFYLKEAQNIFPVISIDVGRTGTVVFTSPVKLDWSDGENQFVQQVTPAN